MKQLKSLTLITLCILLGVSFLIVNSEMLPDKNIEDKIDTNSNEDSFKEWKQTNKLNPDSNQIIPSRYQLIDESLEYFFENQSVTAKLDKTSYKPGEDAQLNLTSDSAGLNGTVKWDLISPLGETYFGFLNDLTRVAFDDPTFDEETDVLDWTNDSINSFSSVRIENSQNMLRLITLTNITGSSDINISKINYSPEKQLLDGDYTFSFTHYNTGDNVPLQISIWNGTNYVNFTSQTGGTLLNQRTFIANAKIAVITNQNPQIYISMTNGNTSYYLDNFQLKYNYNEIQYKMTGQSEVRKSSITQTFENEFVDVQNNITIKADLFYSSARNVATANFSIALPKDLIYLGNWQFKLTVQNQRITIEEEPENIGNLFSLRIPINITDTIIFDSEYKFLRRGFNDSTFLPIYENETGTANIYSPGDQIVEIGKLMYQTTNRSFDSQPYSDIEGYLFSNASQTNLKDLTWGQDSSSLQRYNINGFTIQDGNFSLLDISNVTQTWGISYEVPVRGIYGKVDNDLFITFPNSLSFDEKATPGAGSEAVYSYSLNNMEIKFKTEIIEDNLPFNRTYYLTEFLEGSFKINTTHYDSTLNDQYPNHNITLNLAIPNNDLTFKVYVAHKGEEESVMNFVVNFEGDSFYFSQKIDSNLNILNNFDLRITWTDAYNAGDIDAAQMKFASYDSLTYTLLIKGTLKVELPLSKISIKQNQNLEVHFNISIEELSAKARGLRVFGVICASGTTCSPDSNSTISIQEKDGEFTLFYTITDDFEIGEYKIKLYTQSKLELGEIDIVVTPANQPNINEETPFLLILVGAGLVSVILITYIGVIFIKYR